MADHGRNRQIDRALKLVSMVEASRFGVTIDEIAEALEVSRRGAYRWVDSATYKLPYVFEGGGQGMGVPPGRLRRVDPVRPVSAVGR